MDHLRITVEGKVYDVIVEKIDSDSSAPNTPTAPVQSAGAAPSLARSATPPPASKTTAAAQGDAPSPLAGIVQAIAATVGSAVKEGDLVLTLEAMKMYTPINAPQTGTITAVHVKVGDAVEEGQILYTIG